MGTFLFDKIIFGPIKSRRLGVSLGINLLPTNSKICSFDCIYCECGLNPTKAKGSKLPTREIVFEELKNTLIHMLKGDECPDVITFAGNGEPTLHPAFDGIIDDTIALRDEFCPTAKIAVLSNATMLNNDKVYDSLKKIDQNILKLDSAIESTVRIINQPQKSLYINDLIVKLESFRGDLILQTMFVKGIFNDTEFDNTTDIEIEALNAAYAKICPKEIMIYSIDRDTPITTLKKVTKEELISISQKLQLPPNTKISIS